MKHYKLIALLVSMLTLAACGQSGEEATQAVTDDSNAVTPQSTLTMDITAIELVEIVPGLSSRLLQSGSGAVAEPGHIAVVHYTGWLYDADGENFRGEKFDSSVDRGQHFEFPLGAGRVIKGWDEGVVGMQIGETRELTIAPEMGYGERGAGAVIPPGSTLVFVVELADLKGLDSEETATQ